MAVAGVGGADLFGRRDLGGLKKAGWFLFILLLPILGSVAYLLLRPKTISEAPGINDEVWGQDPSSFPSSLNQGPETMIHPYQDRR